MDCLHDIAPSDEDLLIGCALDGEALSEEVCRHLAQREVCQRRMTCYRKVYASL
jgi:hypothetical protein